MPMPQKAAPLAISNWLISVAVLIFLMVIVGGITRLTESGLSITEWKPITGVVPPMGELAWQEAFDKYQQIPEYKELKGPQGMSLEQFKFIYFWEWVHRILGRLIGFAFAFPLLWFWLRRQIPAGYKWRCLVLFALGGMQGVIGWWMVSSGLSERTDVSHYRLAVHLITALVILAAMLWVALDLRPPKELKNRKIIPARFRPLSLITLLILFVELTYGAFMAGLNAGHVSHTWPMMHGRFLPYGIEWHDGFWHAVTGNPFLVHFIHRWWAWLTAAVVLCLGYKVRKDSRPTYYSIISLLLIQILLGITTVLTQVNITVAVMHQGVGTLLLAAVVWAAHSYGKANELQL